MRPRSLGPWRTELAKLMTFDAYLKLSELSMERFYRKIPHRCFCGMAYQGKNYEAKLYRHERRCRRLARLNSRIRGLKVIIHSGGGMCPTQFYGETLVGGAVYIRYRHGRLTVGVGATEEEAVDNVLFVKRCGAKYDGDVSLERVVALSGLDVTIEREGKHWQTVEAW